MSEHEPVHLRNPERDGRILLPDTLKERMPALYSQEQERDPLVVCKFFDPVGSWTWYPYEGSPVDEDGYYDTDKPKVDYLFFGLVNGLELEYGYFSLSELEAARGPMGLPIERDRHYEPKTLKELEKMHEEERRKRMT